MNQELAQSLIVPWENGSAVVKGPLTGSTAFSGTITLGSILSRSIPFIFLFAGIGVLLMLLAGGFTFLTSAGDAKKMEKGQQQITNAILGFVIIFVAFWLVQALGYIFGFDTIKSIFK